MTSMLTFYSGPEVLQNFGLWVFLSIGAVSLFVVFIPLVSWIDSRRKEREAFYKADTIRRLAESSGEGAKAAIEMLRAEERQKLFKAREGMKIGGLVCIGVGAALALSMVMSGERGSWVMGVIPACVGIALLVYVYLLAAPVE